eukprot:TRINITY_DN11806_c0_g4_i1.p1 TRINITY_DN11806_c0_g4~~TRINITY_DN11806_c0_g4_i1.p1  ORF type:complete len:1009 (-),score=132.31 TRINITY_DN11806_c0_g4_i1:117-3143(-)
MPTYDIGGIPVEFPYEAYECQLAYMAAVIKALEDGSNALLESPTGTGKTLCLLCAALGWRRQRERRVTEARTSWEAQAQADAPAIAEGTPKIWFASRTHSQLKQVIRELKRTSYRPLSMVLGSRERFCVHSSVSRQTGARQNAMCKRARDDNRCSFYTGLRRGKGNGIVTSCLDIEEIVSACRTGGVCPYYKSREDAKDAEILLIPYDYLINPVTRASLSMPLKGNVLIFDEAHNIEKSCEGIASFELTSKELAGAIDELDDAFAILETDAEACEKALGDITSEQLMAHINFLKKNLLGLEQSISSESLDFDKNAGRTLLRAPGSRILQLLARGGPAGDGLSSKDLKRVSDVVRATISVLTFSMDSTSSGGTNLEKIQSLLLSSYKVDAQELDKKYQMLVFDDEEAASRAPKRKAVGFFASGGTDRAGANSRTLCLWCFSSSVAMHELEQQGIRCVLLTSGTLAPLDDAARTFGIPFPIVLENKHVIDNTKQLWGGVLCRGPAQTALDASFSMRGDPAYHRDLGHAIAAFAKNVPDGILVAFQSYGQKEDILKVWRQMGVWDDIAKQKPIFVEPKTANEVNPLMAKYNEALDARRGAILCAVSRGKLCEGIDFSDRQCRMVIMVGIPYPSKTDLKVQVKQSFLDDIGTFGDGKAWYVRETKRAMNQTVGRVIRHKDDYGAVLLCDGRYANGNRLSGISMGLSSWLRPRVFVPDSFDIALSSCCDFFGGKSLSSGCALAAEVQSAGGSSSSTAPAAPNAGRKAASTSSANAASGQKASGAIPISALGALLRRRPKPGSEPAPTPAVAEASSSLPSANPSPKPVQEMINSSRRAPPTPIINAGGGAEILARDGSLKKDVAKDGSKVRIVGARATANASAPPSGKAAAWLSRAESLLPRLEYINVRKTTLEMLKDADIVCDAVRPGAAGSSPDAASQAEKRMLVAMGQIAEALIPVFSLDTPDERSRREALVRDCGDVLPRLLAPLWREAVKDLCRGRGQGCELWTAGGAA